MDLNINPEGLILKFNREKYDFSYMNIMEFYDLSEEEKYIDGKLNINSGKININKKIECKYYYKIPTYFKLYIFNEHSINEEEVVINPMDDKAVYNYIFNYIKKRFNCTIYSDIINYDFKFDYLYLEEEIKLLRKNMICDGFSIKNNNSYLSRYYSIRYSIFDNFIKPSDNHNFIKYFQKQNELKYIVQGSTIVINKED